MLYSGSTRSEPWSGDTEPVVPPNGCTRRRLARRRAARAAPGGERATSRSADALRDRLKAAGVAVEDTLAGPRWEIAGDSGTCDGRQHPAARRETQGRHEEGHGRRIRRPAPQVLEGKGPTPKAEQRPGHPSARRTGSARRAAPSGRTGGRGRQTERGRPGSAETVAGRNAVVEALRAQVPVKALYVAERIDVDDRVREVMKIALDRRLPLLEAPRPELDRITGGAVHQGLALTVPPYEYAHPDDLVKAARTPVRSHWSWRSTASPIRGTSVRSCDRPPPSGRTASWYPSGGVRALTAGAWKTSAGAAARVRVAKATNLARQLRLYADAGMFVVGLAGSGDVDISAIEAAAEPLCLVVGSEDSGLSRVVQQSCDLVVRIPMAKEVESLNAGVAAGIALYEIARARRS